MGKLTKGMLIGILLLYVWCFYVYISTPVRTDIVKYGELEDFENIDAYVIRKEHLIYSNIPGNFNAVVQEGEKVAKGAKIATIYKNNVDKKIQEMIKDLDERIANIKSNQAETTLFSSDLQKLNNKIEQKVTTIIELASTGNGEKLTQLKSDINKILNKKLVISGEKGASGYNLKELQKEKEKYESQLRSSKVDLIAEKSGVVSYDIDQMEQILNPDNINKFTPSDFMALENMEFSDVSQDKNGQAVAKIVDNFEWFLGFLIDEKKISSLETGDYVKVRFNDFNDVTADAYVRYISPEEKGKVVVVLSLDKQIDSLCSIRKINVDVIQYSYSGFKIPTSSIRVRNGKTGVYVIRERIVKFCEVEILFKNNDFAIVKENNLNRRGLLLYDEVIVKSGNIEEGTLIR